MNYNEKERVYEYLQAQGRQAPVQISVGLQMPLQSTERLLEELRSDGRVRRVALPKHLENLPQATDKPSFLYEAK
ncbi:MAG: hypothetical protein AABY16_00505, partial [Nanoarchaeota archaeon]